MDVDARSRRSGLGLWMAAMLGALQLFACASAIPPVDVAKLRGANWASAGTRTLIELDITGDGVLSATDARAWTLLAERAKAALGDLPVEPPDWLYEGPPKGAAPVFSLVAVGENGFDASGVPEERRRELYVEARWAARQVGVLSAAGPLEASDERLTGLWAERFPGYHHESMSAEAVCAGLGLTPDIGVAEPVAIFDLDSTVWLGNVMDPFLAALVESGNLTPDANQTLRKLLENRPGVDQAAVAQNDAAANGALLLQFYLDESVPEAARVSAKDMFYGVAALLEGMSTTRAAELAQLAFDRAGAHYPAWDDMFLADSASSCTMRGAVAELQGAGVAVYLLSATHDLLAREAARRLGVPQGRVLGSVLEVRDGIYTGKVAASTYYTKGAVVRQWLPSPPVLAFGDSPSSDAPMLLEAVGPAFMINARPQFLEVDARDAAGRFVAVTFDSTEGTRARAMH